MNAFIYCPCDATIEADGETLFLPSNNTLCVCDAKFLKVFCADSQSIAFLNLQNPSFRQNVKLTALYDGYLVVPHFRKACFNVERQRVYKTISYRGEQILFETNTFGEPLLKISGFTAHTETMLSFIPESIELFPHESLPLVLAVLSGEKTSVVAINLESFSLEFKRTCDSVSLNKTLTLVSHLNNFLKQTITSEWKCGFPFECVSQKVTSAKKDVVSELIPYAFLEEVRVGGDYSRFLTDKIKERAELLPQFLGEFKFVLPPLLQEFPTTLALIYRDKARYAKISCENNLISDVSLDDFPS